MKKNKTIGKSEIKFDALSHATGNSLFTDDYPLNNPIQIRLLYSPHAHAEIIDIDDSKARELAGVIDVFHFKNVKPILHTTAGQGFPEPSPYDTVMFDKKVRFVGDRVAAVLAEDTETAEKALKLIKVEYRKLNAVFDPEKALEEDAPQLHENDHYMPIPVPYDPKINLAALIDMDIGDVDKGLEQADEIIERTYETHYGSHCTIEPHAAVSYFDQTGRLTIISTTQVPFHARRILARVLEFPLKKIRVIKPRIGGGFGAKQEVFLEQIVGLATIRHKRAARIVLNRAEVFQSSRTRHPIKIKLKTGIKRTGEITALSMDSILNSGAYGTHALTILSNNASKVLPIFNKIPNIKFYGRSVYTNLPIGGAYRGYGALQGYFALNQQLDIICDKLGLDLLEYIKENHLKAGETSPVFEKIGEGTEGVKQIIHSCELSRCIDVGAREIGWYEKRRKRLSFEENKVRGVGLGISMQGSAIPFVDMASSYIKMNDDGSFNLDIGATDIGTGSDTILAQIAAEVISTDPRNMIVTSSDTDRTPFDVGAYASSTTYASGHAVRKCAEKIKNQIIKVAAAMLNTDSEEIKLSNSQAIVENGDKVSFAEICTHALYTDKQFQIQASASYVPKLSPPPFAAQFVEIEVDKETGMFEIINFVSVVDCGQAINPRLAEGQVEGATINGITYALTEEYNFTSNGQLLNRDFNNYKIWSAADLPPVKTILVESYEETGPFGAKSVGEVAINGPMPALANAIYDAVGVRLYKPPFTPDKIYKNI